MAPGLLLDRGFEAENDAAMPKGADSLRQSTSTVLCHPYDQRIRCGNSNLLLRAGYIRARAGPAVQEFLQCYNVQFLRDLKGPNCTQMSAWIAAAHTPTDFRLRGASKFPKPNPQKSTLRPQHYFLVDGLVHEKVDPELQIVDAFPPEGKVLVKWGSRRSHSHPANSPTVACTTVDVRNLT